ncbi:MAG TPA: glycosyltransferase [Bacteroidia bacterium]|nr:glycosyltransferase [Bacteroidia bacterium]
MTKFTVVIPTRERADTLSSTLKTCVAQDYKNLTILVSDNCSTDSTPEIVSGFKDERITYIRPAQRLSMSEHWDFALGHVDGGYVCIIGDDDGLAPNALEHVDAIIRETGTLSVSSKDKAIYFWPGYLEEKRKGLLQLSLNNTYRMADTAACMEKSRRAMLPLDLPQLYHGFVDISFLKSITGSGGAVFKGSIPDIYSSVLLGISLKEHVLSNYPFTIHGLSHHSIGTSFFNKKLNAEAAEKFIRENKALSHPKMVICGSTKAIFADMLLHAHDHHPGSPEPDMKKVIEACMADATGNKSEDVYQEIRIAMEETARINGLDHFLKEVLKKYPYISQSPESGIITGYSQAQEMLYLPTLEWNVKDVSGAFHFMRHLLSKQPVNNKFSVPPITIPDFLKRKVSHYLRRISGK